MHQQVGETAHPGGERCCAALRVVGSLPTLQVLVQQPAQGADAFFIWRRGKNKLRQGECAEAAGEAGLDGRAEDSSGLPQEGREQGPS